MASRGDVSLRGSELGWLSGSDSGGIRSSLSLTEWSGGGQLWALRSFIPGLSQQSLCCVVSGTERCQKPGDIRCVVTVKYRLITSAPVYFPNSVLSRLIPVVVCLAPCHCLSPWTLARFVLTHQTDPSSSLCNAPPPTNLVAGN